MRITYALLAVSLLLSACNKQSIPYDSAMTVMVDETDPLSVYPSAAALLAYFNLKEDEWQGITIKIVGISDKDMNRTETVALPKESQFTGNSIIRQAKILRFIEQLQACLSKFNNKHRYPNSIIFRAVAKQSAQVHRNAAPRKLLLVYSDLMEHGEANFYQPETMEMLRHNPGIIEKQLVGNQPLPDLTGLQLWLLYAPENYRKNDLYMRVAHLYERLYTAHHATVHIEHQFAQP